MARKRRQFSTERKAEVCRLLESSGKSAGQVSRELDLAETAARKWWRSAVYPGDEVGSTLARGRSQREGQERQPAEARRVVYERRDAHVQPLVEAVRSVGKVAPVRVARVVEGFRQAVG